MAAKVKICGVTSVADALFAAEAGADAIGLNFCARSPRCVSVEVAAAIAAALPAGVCKVGVFVDAPRAEVSDIAARVAQSLAGAPIETVDFILADAHVEGRAGGTGRRVPLDWLVGIPPQRLILA